MPSAIDIKDSNVALNERRPDINSDFAGIYPWDWVRDDVQSFKALQGGLLVAPILQKLILNRYNLFQVAVHLVAPTRQEKAAWITDIAQVSKILFSFFT